MSGDPHRQRELSTRCRALVVSARCIKNASSSGSAQTLHRVRLCTAADSSTAIPSSQEVGPSGFLRDQVRDDRTRRHQDGVALSKEHTWHDEQSTATTRA